MTADLVRAGGFFLRAALGYDITQTLSIGKDNLLVEGPSERLLQGGRVFTADSYAGQPEADVEDIIGRENYIESRREWPRRCGGTSPYCHLRRRTSTTTDRPRTW